MYTNIAQHRTTTTLETETGMVTRAAAQVRQFICGLHGHDSLLHFEQGRMSLLCTSCGHETPGWDVKGTRREREPRVVPMSLVHERRVA